MRKSHIRKVILGFSVFLMLFNIWIPLAAEAAESAGQSGSAAAAFKDIQSHWAYNDIMELAALNIVSGFGDGTFRPNDEITREQFLKILVDLRKYPTGSGNVPFRDVEPNRWSAPYVAAGIEQGILVVGEYPDGFKPSQPITRHEMAVWIVRALQLAPLPQETKLGALKDQADIKNHRDLIDAALQSGIINGYPDGTFRGGNKSTRAEASAMAVRALHYLWSQPSSPDARKIVEYLPNVKIGKSKQYSRLDDQTWIIRDPDLTLRAGDVFVMPPNDQFYGGIAKKVVSVREENGALVVTTTVPKVREVFAKLDIHTTEAIDPRLLTPADPSIQIVASELSSKLAPVELAALTLPCFIIKMDNASYEGLILNASMNFCNLGVDADIGLDVDVDWFDVDLDFYAKLVLLGDVTTNVNVKANKAITKPVYIPLTTPYYVPVFTGVFIKGQFFLKIEPDFKASLEIKFENRFHLEQGFSFSSSQGFQTINKTTNTATLDVNSDVHAALSAGPSAQLTLTLLDIAYAGLEFYPGIRAGFYRYYDLGKCDEIQVDAFLRLDVIAGYDVWVASGNLSRTLIDASYPLYGNQLHCPVPSKPENLSAKLVREIIVPSQLSVGLIDRVSVQLNWSPAKNAASYRVRRADAPGGPFQIIRTIPGTSAAYLDTSTQRGKTYYYQIVAVNAYGESAPTQILPVQVVDQPPPRPTNLKAAREGMNVKLEWDRLDGLIFTGNSSSDPSSLGILLQHNGVKYNVKRSDKERGGLQTIAANLTEPSYIDTTAKFDEDYIYVVTAVDRYGESGYSNFAFVAKGERSDLVELIELPWFIPLLTPPAPEQLTAEGGVGEVVLSWSPVDGAAGYHVKRSTSANGTYETIASSISEAAYTDTQVENGKTYYYKVTAVNEWGFESKDSPIRSATPELFGNIFILPNIPLPDLFRIAAPKNFQAVTDVGSGRIMLSWDAVGGAAGYNVWRSESENGTFTVIAARIGGTAFTDTTAAIGRTYYYKVTAVDQFGNESAATPVRSATPTRGIR